MTRNATFQPLNPNSGKRPKFEDKTSFSGSIVFLMFLQISLKLQKISKNRSFKKCVLAIIIFFREGGVRKRGSGSKKGFTKLWLNWRGLTILKRASYMIAIMLGAKSAFFGPSAKIFLSICRLPLLGRLNFGQNKNNFFWTYDPSFFVFFDENLTIFYNFYRL